MWHAEPPAFRLIWKEIIANISSFGHSDSDSGPVPFISIRVLDAVGMVKVACCCCSQAGRLVDLQAAENAWSRA